MITLFVEENNPLTPNFYNNLIANLQFHQLTCPCGHSGCLSIHGYYQRFVKTKEGKLPFRICRVKCECCSHTHAILLSSMVPYSQISLSDQVCIITNHETSSSQTPLMEYNCSIDESNYRYVIKQYLKHWKQKLLCEKISLHPISTLTTSCFNFFSCQFMQIKNTKNILFFNTT